ncbi:hypothetical protein [Rhodococcus koreensis]
MTSPEAAGHPAEPGSVLGLIQGSPVGDALATPLPSTPLEALQNSPLGPLLDAPLGELPPLPALPSLPPLPPNPVEALLQGHALPALPGVDELFKPLTDLAGSFGTGTFGAFDPTSVLDMSSGLIDQAMSMSLSGLKVLDQIWQSQAAQAAQSQGVQAQASGTELSERGTEISTTTQTAAASVARGNANLMTISESFAATAVAAAPMVMTPPGQAMLLASAAEHIKAAIGVVTQTRTELNEQTLTMNGLAAPVPVPPPPAPGAVAGAAPTSPFAVASTVIEGVGKPMISTVTDGVGDLVSASTQAASVSSSDLPADTVAAKSAVTPAHGASAEHPARWARPAARASACTAAARAETPRREAVRYPAERFPGRSCPRRRRARRHRAPLRQPAPLRPPRPLSHRAGQWAGWAAPARRAPGAAATNS